MQAIDRARRAVTVLLVAAFLLVAPQIAFAGFSTPKASGLAVGAASLVAPSAVQGTQSCTSTFFREGFTITVDGFTDPGPAGQPYSHTYTLVRDNEPVDSITTTAKTATLSYRGVFRFGGRDGSYTLRIDSALRSWTAPAFTYATGCTSGTWR